MRRAGDQVPHFTVSTLPGTAVAYANLWQRRNLLLVMVPANRSEAADRYLAGLDQHTAALTAYDTALVITADPVEGIDPPAAIVADRWGEIHFAAAEPAVENLPGPDVLVEWLRYVQMRCPECEGETR